MQNVEIKSLETQNNKKRILSKLKAKPKFCEKIFKKVILTAYISRIKQKLKLEQY